MAQSRGKRKTARSGKKQAAVRKKREKELLVMKRDMAVLLMLVFCILIFIGNIGLGGVVGRAVSRLFFGLFGIPAYVFPFLLFYLFLFHLSNGAEAQAVRRTAGLIGLYCFVSAFFQLLLYGNEKNTGVAQLFLQSSLDKSGGGLVGGILVKLFGTAFGTAGAYVLILSGMVLFAILLTQKPLLTAMREHSEKAYENALQRKEEKAVSRGEWKEIRSREKEERQDRKTRRKNSRERIARANREKREFDEHFRRSRQAFQSDPLKIVTLNNSDDRVTAMSTDPPRKDPENPAAIPDEIIDNGSRPGNGAPEGKKEAPVSVEGAADAKKDGADRNHMPEEETGKGKNAAGEPKRRKKTSAGEIPDLEIPAEAMEESENYVFPPIDLLNPVGSGQVGDSNEHLKATALKLQETLRSFGVEVTINHISCGPTVTRYELTPQQGVKVSRILSLQDDIKLNLAAADIRIEAPIPGKAAIGIEVPNKTNLSVPLRELLESQAFRRQKSVLAFAVGKDIAGQPVVTDIAKMPHLLIAGATGSGKSVCINTLIMSILYKATPDEVKFIMIDPKVVELSVYNGIPHLFIPVVTDPKKAAGALNWAVSEMTERYQRFAETGSRDIKSYNAKIDAMPEPEDGSKKPRRLPRIVIIVDELADLMMVAQNEVEDAICRLAQLARAAGIHLIIATQRPSVNVITGLIKANMPSRIALSVTSGVDSRTILDMVGAEKLLGKGDMLFYPQGYQKPARVQGAFVSDEEIQKVVEFLSERHQNHEYDKEIEEKISQGALHTESRNGTDSSDQDEYFADAARLLIDKDKASIGMLQRAFRIGFNRAARIMDQLCEAGVVSEEEGTKPRKVLMNQEQFENYLEEN